MFGGATRGPLIAPLIARAIVALVCGGFCAVMLIIILAVRLSDELTTLAVGYLIAVFLLQLLAGTVLLVLPPVVGWTAFTAVVIGVAVAQGFLTHSWLDIAFSSIGAGVFGLALYGLTRLARSITELHAARTALVSSAVAHERLLFARDLHDLLGLSLSAIAPKGELAHRLLEKNPDRARHELAEIQDISRRALADARSVAHGYRDLNLDEESRTAESVLAASRVDVRMDLNHGELPVHIRTALAAVLREGVANVLEHSDAERCDIVMRQAGRMVYLDIVNDGVTGSAMACRGSGLNSLSTRAMSLGGQLTTGLDADGRYRLRLTLPVSGVETGASDGGPGEDAPRTATRLARALVVVVFCGTALLCALWLVELTKDTVAIAFGIGYLLGVLHIQLAYFSRPSTRLRSLPSYAMLVLQAGLVLLPLSFGLPWLALPGFLAGNVLMVLRPAVAAPVFVAIMVGVGAQAGATGAAFDVALNVVGAVVSGSVVYGLTWMARSVTELRHTRLQLTRVAVAEERLRFARDLHDLLGLSLSAITLKSELAQRLVPRCVPRAREEVTEILAISRLALADARLVASGYRELSLHDEFRAAESLLAAAEVEVHLDIKYGELPGTVGTLLATVLREGVTNVLRHSKGERCEIIVRQRDHMVSLDIVNDGVAGAAGSGSAGSGIHNLSYRVALLGGEVTAGLEPDGRFRLRARVPA